MDRREVVPHYEVARLPQMFINVVFAFSYLEKKIEQLVAFLQGQANDPYSHQPVHVKRWPARLRLLNDHRMHVVRHTEKSRSGDTRSVTP